MDQSATRLISRFIPRKRIESPTTVLQEVEAAVVRCIVNALSYVFLASFSHPYCECGSQDRAARADLVFMVNYKCRQKRGVQR